MNYTLTNGDDTIIGTDDADTVSMEHWDGIDVLDLFGGDDVVAGESRRVDLRAGSGNDQVDYRLWDPTENNFVDGGTGNDVIRIVDARHSGYSGTVEVRGGDGDDLLELLEDNSHYQKTSIYDGGAGQDTFVVSLRDSGGWVDMRGIQVSGIENLRIVGATFAILTTRASLFSEVDHIEFEDAKIALISVQGSELITADSIGSVDEVRFLGTTASTNVDMTGSSNRYLLYAGYEGGMRLPDRGVLLNAVDRLTGGSNDDVLDAGLGGDFLDGGAGIDTVDYSMSRQAVAVDLLSNENVGGHAEGDVLTNVENITGSRFEDTIRGDAADNALLGRAGHDVLFGRGGNDLLHGGAGADRLNGGAGIDTVSYAGTLGVRADLAAGTGHAGDVLEAIENLIGSSNRDFLFGDAGANRLDGGADNDRLYGRGGGDVLVGGLGRDVLIGGAGADTFEFRAEIGRDTVNDFENGVDHFRLAGFGSFANVTRSIIDADADGRTDDVLVAYARSGHGSGSFAVLNTGVSAIDAADFIFV